MSRGSDDPSRAKSEGIRNNKDTQINITRKFPEYRIIYKIAYGIYNLTCVRENDAITLVYADDINTIQIYLSWHQLVYIGIPHNYGN